MRKIAILLCSILIISSLSFACSSKTGGDKKSDKKDDKKIHVVTTIFPIYDWVREITKGDTDHVDLKLLADKGVDLHNYQPTADDLVAISNCDLFIYVGGESDKWVEDALKQTGNKNRKVINLMDVLGDSARTEEIVEGMQDDSHHEEDAHSEDSHDKDSAKEDSHDKDSHDKDSAKEDSHDKDSHDKDSVKEDSHDKDSHDDSEHEKEYDEHVWLSLKNASRFCKEISSVLSQIRPDQKKLYSENVKAYVDSLSKLDKAYQEAVDSSSHKTLLFGDRFPFRYLTEDYHLKYYAAFVGCSAETEASFETIKFLAEKTDELGLSHILTIEGPKHKIAETIISNTAQKNQKILTLDSMQSVTQDNIKNGATYLKIMTDNLAVLKEALK